jgi:hypothetical protein
MSLQASNRERLEQEKKIKEYELKKKAATVVVPTDDGRVRQMLRQLNEPITVFGEREVGAMQPHASCMDACHASSCACVHTSTRHPYPPRWQAQRDGH